MVEAAEWNAVTTWGGEYVTEQRFQSGDTLSVWTVQGALRLSLVQSGLVWSGTLTYAATFNSTTSSVGRSAGSAQGTRAVNMILIPPLVAIFFDEPLIVPATFTANSGTSTNFMEPFPRIDTGDHPISMPDAIGALSDTFERMDANGTTRQSYNWTLRPEDVAPFRTLKIWLNTFIPGNLPGITELVPAGPHAGQTMLRGPLPVNDCFLTDQRDFDSTIGASSRIHTEIELNMFTGLPVPSSPFSRCFPTIEVDCEDGDVECDREGAVDRVNPSGILQADVNGPGAPHIEFTLVGASHNPCFTGAPDISFSITVVVDVQPDRRTATARVTGETTRYPAFEAYLAPNSGSPVTAFRISPAHGATPSDLLLPRVPIPEATISLSW
jgi:hypothetical protein